MRRAPASSAIPVAVGDGREASDDRRDDWVARDREVTERLNGVIDSPSRLGQLVSLPDAASRWTRGCGSIEVVVLGPWSSFGRYRRVLGDRLAAVYAHGARPDAVAEGARAPFNCRAPRRVVRPPGARRGDVGEPPAWGDRGCLRLTWRQWKRCRRAACSGVVREARRARRSRRGRAFRWPTTPRRRCVSPRDFAIVGRNDEPTISPWGSDAAGSTPFERRRRERRRPPYRPA